MSPLYATGSGEYFYTLPRWTVRVNDLSTILKIKNAETGSTLDMELEPENTVNEIIESAASFWHKDPGAYVLRRGKKVLGGGATVKDASLITGDVLELIPDPEGG